MVNATNLTVPNINLNKGADYISSLSKSITEKIVEFLSKQGLNVSIRWASILLLLISGLIVFLGIKISKPVLKWILIILGILLAVGLIIPW